MITFEEAIRVYRNYDICSIRPCHAQKIPTVMGLHLQQAAGKESKIRSRT